MHGKGMKGDDFGIPRYDPRFSQVVEGWYGGEIRTSSSSVRLDPPSNLPPGKSTNYKTDTEIYTNHLFF
jgi:hypothetical protein